MPVKDEGYVGKMRDWIFEKGSEGTGRVGVAKAIKISQRVAPSKDTNGSHRERCD